MNASTEGDTLTYVIGAPCIDILDRACVDECPVDCIYEGALPLCQKSSKNKITRITSPHAASVPQRPA
jgi:hypothetical protein